MLVPVAVIAFFCGAIVACVVILIAVCIISAGYKPRFPCASCKHCDIGKYTLYCKRIVDEITGDEKPCEKVRGSSSCHRWAEKIEDAPENEIYTP